MLKSAIFGLLLLTTQYAVAGLEYQKHEDSSPIITQKDRKADVNWIEILPSRVEVVRESKLDKSYNFDLSEINKVLPIEDLEQLQFRDLFINVYYHDLEVSGSIVTIQTVYSLKIFENMFQQVTLNVRAEIEYDLQTEKLISLTNLAYADSNKGEQYGRSAGIIDHYDANLIENISDAIVWPYLSKNPELIRNVLPIRSNTPIETIQLDNMPL